MEKNHTIVSIDGRDYPVTSVESVEHIQEIAQVVDKRVRAIRRGAVLNPMTAIVFTALNLADDLSKRREEVFEETTDLRETANGRKHEVRYVR